MKVVKCEIPEMIFSELSDAANNQCLKCKTKKRFKLLCWSHMFCCCCHVHLQWNLALRSAVHSIVLWLYCDILFMVSFSCFLFRSLGLSLNLILFPIIIIPVFSPALQFEFHLNVSYCLYSTPSIHPSLFVSLWSVRYHMYSPTCVQWIKTSISFLFWA